MRELSAYLKGWDAEFKYREHLKTLLLNVVRPSYSTVLYHKEAHEAKKKYFDLGGNRTQQQIEHNNNGRALGQN